MQAIMKTPTYIGANQTPVYEPAGGMTPNVGYKTPMQGAFTPMM